MSFEIAWTVDNDEWDRARELARSHEPGCEFDFTLLGLDDLLVGSIHFMQNGHAAQPVRVSNPSDDDLIFWSGHSRLGAETSAKTWLAQGFDVPLAEFAWQLAVGVDNGGFRAAPDGAIADYKMTLDALAIRFHKSGEIVRILSRTSADRNWMVAAPTEEFFAGARSFLKSFVEAVYLQIPVLLTWTTFSPLRPYLEAEEQ